VLSLQLTWTLRSFVRREAPLKQRWRPWPTWPSAVLLVQVSFLLQPLRPCPWKCSIALLTTC